MPALRVGIQSKSPILFRDLMYNIYPKVTLKHLFLHIDPKTVITKI